MRKWQSFALRVLVSATLCALVTPLAISAGWASLGPEGGGARAFAYDPKNPDRIYMGTIAGRLFPSTGGGANWTRLPHLRPEDNYVLDNIAIHPNTTTIIYAAAWAVG